ncbi:MAG: hypothetical protein HY295_00225 [Thaumarchaeota archaeon]|nr:hypothetical protein [Nitrososphaerota archaeon]
MFVLNGNQEKVLLALRRCGLSQYEGRVLFTLQMTGESTAWNLSRKSGVPQSKIYGVIYKMLDKRMVGVSDGNPLTVKALPLEKHLDRYQKRVQKQIQKDRRYLGRIIKNLRPCFKPYDRYVRIFAPRYNGR